MKKIRKSAGALFVAAIIMSVAAVSGCQSQSTDAPGVQNPSQATEKPKLGSNGELNIFTWEEYIPSEVVKDFEDATGIRVNYSTFGTNEEMQSRVNAQKNSYDIIVCSDYMIDIMRRENAWAEIDTTKVPNFKNIDPNFQGQYYDPDNKYAVPYTTATAIIVYDKSKVDFPVTGYADLWNPVFQNKVVLIDGARDIIGFTLQMLGYSLNETNPAHLAEAEAKLMELKPNIVKFDSDNPHDMLIRGDATIGYMFGSQATAAMDEVPNLDICYPEEGLTFCIDNVVVPAGAPNYDNAMTFLNYILDGEVSAKISSIINYTNTNTAAEAFLPQVYKDNKTFNIPDELMSQAEMFLDLGDTSTLYDEIWTRFKSR